MQPGGSLLIEGGVLPGAAVLTQRPGVPLADTGCRQVIVAEAKSGLAPESPG